MLDQAKAARVAGQIPHAVGGPHATALHKRERLRPPVPTSSRPDLGQMAASLLEAEQRKQAKTPPQPDPHDALDGGHARVTERKSRDRGHSRVRGEDRQKELDKVRARQ